jgi:hypothetical protein
MEGARSIHALPWAGKQVALFLESARYAVHTRSMHKLLRDRGELQIDYENLKQSTNESLARVCDVLGLGYEDSLIARRFSANSSYLHAPRGRPLSDASLQLAEQVYLPLFFRVPKLGETLLRARDRARRGHNPLAFRLLRYEVLPESLYSELTRTGEIALRDLLFGGRNPSSVGKDNEAGRHGKVQNDA